MRVTNIFLFIILVLLAKQSICFATELNSDDIERFAESFLKEKFPSSDDEKILINLSSLDPRIVIKPCNVPLTAHLPDKNNARNVNVKISCNESTPWTIYLSARIEITKAILVAKSTINKDDRLDENNVEFAYVAVNSIRGSKITDKSVIFGAKAKRRIALGKAISKKSICLVCKGDVVTIIASSDSFSIKTQGIALTSGNIDEQIRVKNTRSNNIITPRVKSHNKVIINL